MRFFVLSLMLAGLFLLSGCVNMYNLDGKRFASPEQARDYLRDTYIPKKLAEVEEMHHFGGSLVYKMPPEQQLLSPPFIIKSGNGVLTQGQKKFFIFLYEGVFDLMLKSLQKSNMYDKVELRRCHDLNTYAKQNGFNYTLKNTGKNFILTEVKTGQQVDIGLTTEIKYSIKSIEGGMRELLAKIPQKTKIKSKKNALKKKKIKKKNNDLPDFLK